MADLTMPHLAMPSRAVPQSPQIAQKMAALHDPENRRAVREAATKFEALYLTEMFTHMFAGVEVDDNFGGGKGEEIFRSLLIEQYSEMAARSGQVGLADQLEKEMLRMQEAQLDPRNNPAGF